MQHGKGKMEYSDGSVYIGEWKQGFRLLLFFTADLKKNRDGEGQITWKNGDRYTGNFKRDLKDGEGVFAFHNGVTYGCIPSRDFYLS